MCIRDRRDAEDARDRVQRELAALRSRQSQQLNAQWNQRQALAHQQQQRPPPQQQYQAPPPPRARAAAPPPSSDVAVARVIPGATPAQWACPHCTFANLLHRTQTTAAGLSICELCTRTARVQ